MQVEIPLSMKYLKCRRVLRRMELNAIGMVDYQAGLDKFI